MKICIQNTQPTRPKKEFQVMMKKFLSFGILIAFISITPAPAFAVGSGGFENASFSAKQLGLGSAVTATPDEPAAISYNPAGIADLPGIQVQGNANFISFMTFKKNSVEGNSRSTGTLNLVPTGYITINPGKIFQNKLGLGIGMDSPFGLSNKYRSNDPSVKYSGYSNFLKMWTLKPTIAYKITDKISVGGGPMWYRVEDFGGVQAYPSGAYPPPYGTGGGNGQVRLNTSGNHWGWQMGALIKLTPKHRLGYYFRSPVVVKTSGLGKVENSSMAGSPGRFETGVYTKLSLPMNMTWAYAYQPTEKTHYEVDFTWSHWKTHKRLYWNVDPTGSVMDDAVMNDIREADKDWRDSFGIQLGASHKLTKKLTLRGGSWFYWTPVPYDHFTPAVPDANHWAVSIGAGYDINKYLTADLCYYNSFYFRRHIKNPAAYVDGTYTSYSQAFTISLTAKWDDIFPRSFGNKGNEAAAPSIDMPGATK